jgi:hypothetical protein
VVEKVGYQEEDEMTTFEMGQEVVSTVDAQGLKKGRKYRVTDIAAKTNLCGTFTSYMLADVETGAQVGWVGNGHLVLKLPEYAIEAHGVKGMKSTPWRKTFKSVAKLNAWVEKNDAEVYATRKVEE